MRSALSQKWFKFPCRRSHGSPLPSPSHQSQSLAAEGAAPLGTHTHTHTHTHTGLVRTLAKEPGSAAVESQRPIALQEARLKWLKGILLLQLQDALFQIVPQGQKAYLKGRTMYEHIASVQQRWDRGIGDGWACWVAVDYSKAYDSVSHPMLSALRGWGARQHSSDSWEAPPPPA